MKKEVQLTAKSLTIDDLDNDNHVGFIDASGDKGHVCYVGGKGYIPICVGENQAYGNFSYGSHLNSVKATVKEAIQIGEVCDSKLRKVYVFDTRKELYQWLAED